MPVGPANENPSPGSGPATVNAGYRQDGPGASPPPAPGGADLAKMSPDDLLRTGREYFRQGNLDEAESLLRRALAILSRPGG